MTDQWLLVSVIEAHDGVKYQMVGPEGTSVTGWRKGTLEEVIIDLHKQAQQANQRRQVNQEWQDWAWIRPEDRRA